MATKQLLAACILLASSVNAFQPSLATSSSRSTATATAQLWSSKVTQEAIDSLRERQTRLALVEAQLSLPSSSSKSLQEVFVLGQAQLELPSSRSQSSTIQSDRFRPCVVLSVDETATSLHDNNKENKENVSSKSAPALLLPLASPAQLKLLKFAKADRPLSKSVLLGLNPLLVNRDGALFDNLPWNLWSVDPQQRNYDAAKNPIAKQFHLGKRDAFNRFMGRDWQGRSLSIGNMALRLKYLLEVRDEEKVRDVKAAAALSAESLTSDDIEEDDSASTVSLAQRILELQIRELEMDLAELDYQLAIARKNKLEQVPSLEEERQSGLNQLEDTKTKLQTLVKEATAPETTEKVVSSMVGTILQDVADWTTNYGENKAPYRGAIGYAPMLDTEADIEGSTLPYTSPFDLLKEILDDQLNCEVIGAVLENTSLLEGTLALGGALILQRKIATKTVTIAGEQLEVKNEDEEFGNMGAKGGETMLVECDSDEAIGMALAYRVPIQLEPGSWDRSNTLVVPILSSLEADQADVPLTSMRDILPRWTTLDPEMSLLVEGQAKNESTAEKSSPPRIPRTTASLYDSMFEPTPSDAPFGMFPTDNPIQSLDEYDELNDETKARTLLTMSNFDCRLPRPRVLRKEKASGTTVNTLDDLLLPLIDESARRQYLMRDAELRGDRELLEQLRNEKTKYQVAKEKAEDAREQGEVELAEYWDTEAELYGGLRADVTQDEGAYSRFLDRDEWYERIRQIQAKNLDKKKFGTLLDGIE